MKLNKIKKIILTLFFLYPQFSHAVPDLPPGMPDGGCWADPMNILIVQLTENSFTGSEKGTKLDINFTTDPVHYPGWCYSEAGANSASFFTGLAGMSLIPSKINSGYFKINDDIDVKLMIKVNDLGNKSIPFKDLNPYANAGPTDTGITPIKDADVGNSGKVQFILRRDIIGGAILFPAGLNLLELYRYVYEGSVPPIPMYRLVTSNDTIIPVPNICSINNNNPIDISFGIVDSSTLKGEDEINNKMINKSINLSCNNNLSQEVTIKFIGDPSPFSQKALKTTNEDLGVILLHNDSVIPPGEGFPAHISGGLGTDEISLKLIKNIKSEKVQTGSFSASATLIITTS